MNEKTETASRRRWPWALLALVVLLVVAAAVAIPMLLDVERYRGTIERALGEATGWDPELGAIDLRILPRPTVRVSPATLVSPAGKSRLEIGSIEVAVALRPLLSGKLDIEHVTLRAPRARLVRPDDESGWDLPLPPPKASDAQAGEGSRFEVRVQRIEVRDGSVVVEDRTADPPRTIELDPFDFVIEPDAGRFSGTTTLAAGANLKFEGSLDTGIVLDVADLSTDLLSSLSGSDLLAPGGSLTGQVQVGFPLAVDASFDARGLGLRSGERPLDTARLEFRAVADGEGLLLERVVLATGPVTMTGSGRLAPGLDLTFEVPQSPLAATLDATRAIVPFPLDLREPGTAGATLRVFDDDTGVARYTAHGRLTAAALVAADYLPPVESLDATFDLDAAGRLVVRVTEGQVAGGPFRGDIVLDRVDPPGTLQFTGSLRDAGLGGLLAGFAADASQKIAGPASVQADLRLDLGRSVTDAGALGGTIALSVGEVTLPGWDIEGRVAKQLADKLGNLDLAALAGQDGLDSADLGIADTPVAFDSFGAAISLDALPWTLADFRLERGSLTALGGGSFDPRDGVVRVDLVAWFDRERSAELIEDVSALSLLRQEDGRLRVPFLFEGPIGKPSAKVDLRSVSRDVLGSKDKRQELLRSLKKLLDRKDE